MNKASTLVLGCTGSVGSRVVKSLLDHEIFVYGVRFNTECGIRHPLHNCYKYNLLEFNGYDLIRDLKPQNLIHTAWESTPGVFWDSPLNNLWLAASKQIISIFQEYGGEYLAVTGSCAEYCWETDSKLNENSPTYPSTEYGINRLNLFNWLKDRPINILWTRTFFQYGLNEPHGRLIPSVIDNIIEKKVFLVNGKNDIRDFVFVEDVALNLSSLILKKEEGIFNLGSGIEVKVEDLIGKIIKILGGENLVNFENNNKSSYVVSDPRKLESTLGRNIWKNLDESLIKTIESRIKTKIQ